MPKRWPVWQAPAPESKPRAASAGRRQAMA
jgi:hypothetical protein